MAKTAQAPSDLTRRALFACIGGAALAVARNADATPFDIADTQWEGLSQFYEIAKKELGPDRIKPVATLDWSAVRADDGVLFLHPTEPIEAQEASEFMKLGGRVAVIDDFGRGDDLLKRFKIQRVRLPGRPVAALRSNPELPIAEPWLEISRGQIGSPHPVVANVKRMVLNHPMALVHPDLSPVLKVRLSGTDGDAIVAVAGQVDKGRLFAMSDPSALINSMLRYPGNRAFAAGLVRYLANDAERGQGRLFLVANRYKQEGSVGGDRSMVQDAEAALRQFADSLADVRKTGLPSWLLAISAAVAVAAMGIWVGRASGKPYKSPLPRYARATPLVARGGVAGRFAMLAAPSSPKSLVLLELKSALFEGVAAKMELESNPGSAAVLGALRAHPAIDEGLFRRIQAVVKRMDQTEAVVLAGGSGARIQRDVVIEAHAVTQAVIEAIGVLDSPRTSSRHAPTADGPPHDRFAPHDHLATDEPATS